MPFVQSLVTALELVSIRLMNQEKEAGERLTANPFSLGCSAGTRP
jgi:hypothetical protein